VPILPPVTLNPITKRHACAGSPLLASSIPILLAPHADLALLQANIIKTMHPWPDPPPLWRGGEKMVRILLLQKNCACALQPPALPPPTPKIYMKI
jgi:hypothetical protein